MKRRSRWDGVGGNVAYQLHLQQRLLSSPFTVVLYSLGQRFVVQCLAAGAVKG